MLPSRTKAKSKTFVPPTPKNPAPRNPSANPITRLKAHPVDPFQPRLPSIPYQTLTPTPPVPPPPSIAWDGDSFLIPREMQIYHEEIPFTGVRNIGGNAWSDINLQQESSGLEIESILSKPEQDQGKKRVKGKSKLVQVVSRNSSSSSSAESCSSVHEDPLITHRSTLRGRPHFQTIPDITVHPHLIQNHQISIEGSVVQVGTNGDGATMYMTEKQWEISQSQALEMGREVDEQTLGKITETALPIITQSTSPYQHIEIINRPIYPVGVTEYGRHLHAYSHSVVNRPYTLGAFQPSIVPLPDSDSGPQCHTHLESAQDEDDLSEQEPQFSDQNIAIMKQMLDDEQRCADCYTDYEAYSLDPSQSDNSQRRASSLVDHRPLYPLFLAPRSSSNGYNPKYPLTRPPPPNPDHSSAWPLHRTSSIVHPPATTRDNASMTKTRGKGKQKQQIRMNSISDCFPVIAGSSSSTRCPPSGKNILSEKNMINMSDEAGISWESAGKVTQTAENASPPARDRSWTLAMKRKRRVAQTNRWKEVWGEDEKRDIDDTKVKAEMLDSAGWKSNEVEEDIPLEKDTAKEKKGLWVPEDDGEYWPRSTPIDQKTGEHEVAKRTGVSYVAMDGNVMITPLKSLGRQLSPTLPLCPSSSSRDEWDSEEEDVKRRTRVGEKDGAGGSGQTDDNHMENSTILSEHRELDVQVPVNETVPITPERKTAARGKAPTAWWHHRDSFTDTTSSKDPAKGRSKPGRQADDLETSSPSPASRRKARDLLEGDNTDDETERNVSGRGSGRGRGRGRGQGWRRGRGRGRGRAITTGPDRQNMKELYVELETKRKIGDEDDYYTSVDEDGARHKRRRATRSGPETRGSDEFSGSGGNTGDDLQTVDEEPEKSQSGGSQERKGPGIYGNRNYTLAEDGIVIEGGWDGWGPLSDGLVRSIRKALRRAGFSGRTEAALKYLMRNRLKRAIQEYAAGKED